MYSSGVVPCAGLVQWRLYRDRCVDLSETGSNSSLNGSGAREAGRRIFAAGEMAERIAALEWGGGSSRVVGGAEEVLAWSINSMLESRFPTLILWGREMLAYYNDAFIPLAEEKHPALLGQPGRAAWAEAWEIIGPQLESVLNDGASVHEEKMLVPVRRDGVLKDIYWTYSYSPIRDLRGGIGGILVVCHDVTGEVLTRRERDLAAKNLQNVLESITDGVVMLDKDWRFTYFNEQGASMLGMQGEDLIGECVWELFPAAKGTKFEEHYLRAVESNQPTHFEEYYPAPVGKWLECNCYPVTEGLSVYFRDITQRKLREEALRQSEARFRTLFELAPVGVAITDAANGNLLFANAELAGIMGYSVAELTQMSSNDIVHPEDREQNREFYERCQIGDVPEEPVLRRYRRKDGGMVWARVRFRMLHDPELGLPRLLGTVEDVTASLNVERAREESEARLAALVDSIPALAWMADEEGAIFWYNRRWYEYTGTVAEEMEGWGWQSVHDPATLPLVLERWKESIRTGEPCELVFPLRGSDGVFRSFLTRVLPVRDAEGKVTRWFGTNTEIDEMERTRQELTLAQERMRLALRNVPLILYTTDRELRYTWVHRTHEKFDMDEVIGKTDEELDSSGALAELIEFKKSVLERGIYDSRELALMVKGVAEIYDMSAEPIRGPDGSVIGLMVAAHNITRQRLAEEALRKTEKLAVAGRLAAAISHEINNPLEAVTNILYLLRSTADAAEASAYVQMAEEELARVSQIVTQSLRFHRQSTVPTSEKISTVLDSAAEIYRTRLVPGHIEIRREYGDRSEVYCYSSEMRQVFGNYIGNALDAVRQGGTICLRTREAREVGSGRRGIRITVADSGHGMDAETMQRISEPFFTTKGSNGTGLGLWISKDILQKHHATLRVRSRVGEGRSGTVFSVFLPLVAIEED